MQNESDKKEEKMKKAKLTIISAFFFWIFLGLNATVLQATEAPILTKLTGQEKQRVADLIQKAKKEGALVYATNIFPSANQETLHSEFKKLYGLEGLKITLYLLKAGDLVSRIDQEVKAQKIMIDWFLTDEPSFFYELHRRGALLKYCSEEYKHFEKISKQALIPNEPCYYQNQQVICFTALWNPEYIRENITSWWDLTNPKYRGKIIVADATKAPVYLDTYIVMRQIFGLDFFEKLASLNPFFLVRSTEIRDKVMSGEFPIAFWGLHQRAYQIRKDIPVNTFFPKEGSVFLPTIGAILKGSKNPNAAKLWVDFIYGERGQSIMVEEQGILTARENMKIPPEVARLSPALGEIKPIPYDWSKLTEEIQNKYKDEFARIFKK
jgi:iron(III) transport system substrate-binding protein